ncbi:MAG: hypothetical protein DWC06_07045 [Candidatus Poseidoniales archaeon]|nr:hypothetical protein [Candidatus Poseidoniales archaeon]RJV00253.1 MAG: hypothetical protein DWC06_07045 [Candidatus Poseidoniales archaeon]|tara:strand:- start:1792 stop:2202 length:411 start_codon:yes stop_codon:yes gene_type:complete
MTEQFTVAGQSIPTITMGYGGFLVLWGIVVSQLSDASSLTSYIPSFMGIPLLVSGILASKFPEKRKLWMHIAATFGLLCALGGLDFLRGMFSDEGPFALPAAGASKLMLLITGSVYTYICVQSFIHARKAREAREE